MHVICSACIILSWLVCVRSSLEADLVKSKTTFVLSHSIRDRNGPLVGQRREIRQAPDRPPDLVQRTDSRAQTSDRWQVNATLSTDVSEYESPFQIGGQPFLLEISTGFSDFWVFSSKLPAELVREHRVYNTSQSSSYEALSCLSWSFSNGELNASGSVGTDVVSIGGAVVPAQAIQLVDEATSDFIVANHFDGIVGLGFSGRNKIRPLRQLTLFDNMRSELSDPIFSVDLRTDNYSSYLFGAKDPTRYTGELTTIFLQDGAEYWQVPSPTFRVGNESHVHSDGSSAILDTGTSLILIEPDAVSAYYAQVPGSHSQSDPNTCGKFCGYRFPCNASLPDLGLSLGPTYIAKIPAGDLIFAWLEDGVCFGSVQSKGGRSFQTYGAMFFSSQYVVFDGKTNVVHIAPKVNHA